MSTSPLNQLELFLALKEEKGLLPDTLAAYRRDITAFIVHAQLTDVCALSELHVLAWTAHMRSRGLSDGSISTYQRPVWTWLKWLYTTRKLDINLAGIVSKRIVRLPKRRTATEAIHKALVRIAADRAENAYRDVAILETLWWTGVRRAELVTVRYPDDINLTSGVMQVIAKGGGRRSLAVPVVARRAILEYIAHERGDAPGMLWLGRRQPIGKDAIRILFRTLRTLALDAMPGLEVSSHDYRRGCAARMFREGVPVDVIARQLGHKTLPMSLMYGEEGRDEGAINAVHEWDRKRRTG